MQETKGNSLLFVAIMFGYLTISMGSSSCPIKGVPAALSKFSVSLYQETTKNAGKKANVILSPSSASAVLGMTLAGARRNTAVQLKKALHLSMIKDPVCAVGQLSKSDATSTIKSYNRMLISQGFRQTKEFQSSLKRNYGVTGESVNFTSPDIANKLNKKVAKLTNNKIKDLFKPDYFDAMTRVVLLNVLYLKAFWRQPFDSKKTRASLFYSPSLPGGRKVVLMMPTRGDFRIANVPEADAWALELPYTDNRTSMVILLPNQWTGLARLESALRSKDILNTLNKRFHQVRQLTVIIPKFKIDTRMDLKSLLIKLNVTDLFNRGQADLSGIDGSKSLYVTHAMQRAFIQVNEKGTEAGAATAVIKGGRMRPPTPFIANNPFILLIKDDRTGVIHFIGRVVDPKM